MAKTATTKAQKPKPKQAAAKAKGKYTYALGRRKTSTAKVKIFQGGAGKFTINGRNFGEYLKTLGQRQIATAALALLSLEKTLDIEARAVGGGLRGQAQAVNLAIARALVKIDADNKPSLKEHGFMTVDARNKERKKPGLKRARRAPQWRKR